MEGKLKSKSVVFKIFVGIFILSLFNMNGVAKIIANYSDESFEGPERNDIRLHIIEGAGYFLKSYSDFLLFLNKVELSDIESERIDYTELRQIIDNTVVHIKNAMERYDTLKRIADNTPYNQTVISRLLDSNDSSSLLEESSDSKSAIFNEVEIYLRSGDVRGIYHKMLTDTQQILDMLNIIKSTVEAEVLPKNSDLWKVNRFYSKTLLSGQHTAEIFSKITGK